MFKFEPREAGRYTQYWQLSLEPLTACSNTAKLTHKFELCGKVSVIGFLAAWTLLISFTFAKFFLESYMLWFGSLYSVNEIYIVVHCFWFSFIMQPFYRPRYASCPSLSVCYLLAGDVQAKPLVSHRFIWTANAWTLSICLSVRDSLSLWETFTAANCSVASIDFFPYTLRARAFCIYSAYSVYFLLIRFYGRHSATINLINSAEPLIK